MLATSPYLGLIFLAGRTTSLHAKFKVSATLSKNNTSWHFQAYFSRNLLEFDISTIFCLILLYVSDLGIFLIPKINILDYSELLSMHIVHAKAACIMHCTVCKSDFCRLQHWRNLQTSLVHTVIHRVQQTFRESFPWKFSNFSGKPESSSRKNGKRKAAPFRGSDSLKIVFWNFPENFPILVVFVSFLKLKRSNS